MAARQRRVPAGRHHRRHGLLGRPHRLVLSASSWCCGPATSSTPAPRPASRLGMPRPAVPAGGRRRRARDRRPRHAPPADGAGMSAPSTGLDRPGRRRHRGRGGHRPGHRGAAARRSARRVAVLDLRPRRAARATRRFACDVTDRGIRLRGDRRGDRAELGGIDVLVNNAGISAVGTVEEIDDDGVGTGPRRERVGMARATAAALPRAAAIDAAGHRQRLLDRGAQRAPAARPLLRVQGRRLRADVRDGHRPRAGGHPRQRREPRHGAHRS